MGTDGNLGTDVLRRGADVLRAEGGSADTEEDRSPVFRIFKGEDGIVLKNTGLSPVAVSRVDNHSCWFSTPQVSKSSWTLLLVAREYRTCCSLRLHVAEHSPLRAHARHTGLLPCLGIVGVCPSINAVMEA